MKCRFFFKHENELCEFEFLKGTILSEILLLKDVIPDTVIILKDNISVPEDMEAEEADYVVLTTSSRG
ncbi:hypothetical protein L1994_09910 [Methanomicrobium antiquum]|uniref:Uncharacterized protein n=1 Tax=Methanomicrobium antiquum TaxID=487686 RepID=A0AAF0JLT6_9EURY|nr:hypothetical protein [Methanomicrobium antiquum]WFN36447.1 hypothetical protein L1994_09910 [Methanomicrobium antiquum]